MRTQLKTVITLTLFLICSISPSLSQQADSTMIAQEPSTNYVDQTIGWYMQNMNYPTITLLMTIESSFIPFPSEVVIPPAAYKACQPGSTLELVAGQPWINIILVVLFGTLGAVIGALINYFLALWLGRPIIYKFADSRLGHMCLIDSLKVKKAEEYFVKNGVASTFFGRLVPGIRQLISIPAGLAKMPLPPFILYTALGAGIWNAILALLGYLAHGQQEIITAYSKEISYAIGLLALLFIAYIVYKGVRKKNE